MDQESAGVRTSLYSILCIVIRLGAVLFAVKALAGLFTFFSPGQIDAYSAAELQVALLVSGAYLLIAFLLWLYPGPLARLAAARSAHQVFESPLTAGQIQWIALSVLGMSWVMAGIIDLANLGYQYIWLPDNLGTGELAADKLKWEIAYDLLEVVIGISVVLGARGLTNLLHRVRYAGSSGVSPANSSEVHDVE